MVTILKDIKSLLGIEMDDSSFDTELLIHIGSVCTILNQLGVGSNIGSLIDKDTTWFDVLGERKDLEIVKTYIFLKIRLLFDPPQNSFLVKAIETQCSEYEWRIVVQAT